MENTEKYIVFFKCRDKKLMERAFNEFCKSQEKQKDHKSMKQVINEYKEKASELNKKRSQNKHRDRNKQREMSL